MATKIPFDPAKVSFFDVKKDDGTDGDLIINPCGMCVLAADYDQLHALFRSLQWRNNKAMELLSSAVPQSSTGQESWWADLSELTRVNRNPDAALDIDPQL